MNKPDAQPHRIQAYRIGRYFTVLAGVWCAIVVLIMAWDFYHARQISFEMATNEARAHFNKDQALRHWATMQDRIYVPISERMDPDPYLSHVPERDIVSPSGLQLTLINPARIVRQMNEDFSDLYGVAGRITSLTPLRPANMPDPWERGVLESFAAGASEAMELTDIEGIPHLRLMRVMTVEPGCLHCHLTQYGEPGSVAGGVGVAVPMTAYLTNLHNDYLKKGFAYGTLWLLGLLGIGAGGFHLRRREEARLLAEQELYESEVAKSAMLESALDCIITIDSNGLVVQFNPAAEQTFGYARSEVLGRELAELIIPRELRAQHRKGLAQHLRDGTRGMLGQRVKMRALRRDGTTFPVELAITRIESLKGPLFTAYLRDISEQEQAEEALRESEERYALAAQGANDGLWDWDLRRNTIYYSDRWHEIFGRQAGNGDHAPETWFDRVHPSDLENLRTELQAHLEGLTGQFHHEHRIWHNTAGYRWVLSRGLAVRDSQGNALRIAGSLTDITERKLAEEQLRHQALHDALTGLCNRVLLLEMLQHAVERARRRSEYHFAILFLDIDRFKLINDSFGHLLGDQFLIQIAQRLSATVRHGDILARMGGDEFVILLEDVNNEAEAEQMAQRIHQALAEPFKLNDQDIFTSASIGIALGQGYIHPEDILRDADTAMYRAKQQGKGSHVVFDKAMRAQLLAQMEMEHDLRLAMEGGQFFLLYQPIVTLVDGRIVGFEALLRWRHPQHGLITPSEFIPLAEETGLIVAIGEWVVDEAIRQLQAWHKLHPQLHISINLSGKQLEKKGLTQRIGQALQAAELAPQKLWLELTESVLIQDDKQVQQTLQALHELQTPLCIDDFGTGYSSMSYLHTLPVSVLKIDRSFVARIEGDGIETVRAIQNLASSHGLAVVAEGIETAAQFSRLCEMKCTHGQGYLFAKPLTINEAEHLLNTQPFTLPSCPLKLVRGKN